MPSRSKRQTLNTDLEREIDDNLKRAFDGIASENVPDRFTDLLEQLRKSGATGQEGADD